MSRAEWQARGWLIIVLVLLLANVWALPYRRAFVIHGPAVIGVAPMCTPDGGVSFELYEVPR